MIRCAALVVLGLAVVGPAIALDLGAMSSGEIVTLKRRLADAGCFAGAADGIADTATTAGLEKCPLMDPMLRIEAGRHTGSVWRIGVSADGTRLATASEDKTVRLWRLPEGQLERVLRPPVGGGNEGKMYAVAISPDGALVAAAGWGAAYRVERRHYIVLFEAASGAVLRRIGPLPNIILELEFSPDGQRLAVGMAGTAGIRVVDPATGLMAFEDADYQGSVNGLDFDPAGRLAATSYDGNLRLYDAAGGRLVTAAAPGGGRAFGIDFSPDGSRVALGYDDKIRLDVLDGQALAPLFSPDTSGVDNGNLATVVFSADGTTLFATGLYDVQGENPVVAFADGGRGAWRALPGPQSTIFDLAPFGARGLIFGSGEPTIGVIDDAGNLVLDLGRVSADLRDKRSEHFTVSADASRVRFGLGVGGADPVVFDLASLSLDSAPAPEPGLHQADVASLKVEGWINTTAPTLDGNPLPLQKYETARALAILPGQPTPGFLLGAEWTVYRFDAAGQQVWRLEVPGIPWGINLSADGAVAVVAYGDGTIRWHRTDTSAELLALFVHAPSHRWVAWTPSGYYAGSPGGEDLIGWHLNRGFHQAPDFFPAGRFRDRFYRPDIVQAVLGTRDEAMAVATANQGANVSDETTEIASRLPPVVTITPPPDGAFDGSTLTLEYRLRSPSGREITGLDVLLDGRPLSGGRSAVRIDAGSPQDGSHPACPVFDGGRLAVAAAASESDLIGGLDCRLTLALPPQDVEVALVARAGDLAGEPAALALAYRGADKPDPTDLDKPKLYALVVGVSDYEIEHLRLGFAAQDARDIAGVLGAQAGGLYRDVEVRLLADREASRDAVLEGLEWLEGEVTHRDVGLLFLAGHGVTDAKQRFYFITSDSDPERLRSTAVSGNTIQDAIGSLAGKALFFIDACHSAGGLTTERRRSTVDITRVINELSSAENGVVMFSSSTGREVSVEDARWQNGAFTEALLEAFSGQGDLTGDGIMSIAEIDLYVSERVKELTSRQQHPVVRKPDIVPDFPIALVRQ